MRDKLLGYYERELIFLRRLGAEFARKYPKIASRLQLDEDKVEDPHIERMIEAFAYLTSRISLKLDDELPEITESFLNVLYPHYLSPIPSMAITQFSYGSPQDKLTAMQILPRGTRINSRPVEGTACRFRTAFDVQLAPIEMLEAALESPAPKNARGVFAECSIRLSFRCYGDSNLSEMRVGDTNEKPRSLRFYLNGDPQLVFPLYEIIHNKAVSVEFHSIEPPFTGKEMATFMNLRSKQPDPIVLPPDAIKVVGFEENEAVLPFSKKSFAGYRLLSEYFAFPYKFLFFDVEGLDKAISAKFGSHFDIVIRLKDVAPPAAPVNVDTFKMGCSPIVNLFSRTADPIYLSQQKYEYQIIPDIHRQQTTEIYSIDEVVSTDPQEGTIREFTPFYSQRHAYGEQMEKAFWYPVRRDSERENDDGTEVFMSLVDMNFNPFVPAVEVLNVRTTCTNRDLPGKIPFGGKEGEFEIEGTALLSRVRCLTKPTETIRPAHGRAAQWRLISHLNLNYLSLLNTDGGAAEALQEILHLYNSNDSVVTRQQILGITNVESKKVVRRIGKHIGAGFVRGIETTITLNEENYVGSGMYLFANLLERFLALYTNVNSFNETVLRSDQREEIVKRFTPRAGEQVLL